VLLSLFRKPIFLALSKIVPELFTSGVLIPLLVFFFFPIPSDVYVLPIIFFFLQVQELFAFRVIFPIAFFNHSFI
jgi:hypothetical protein